jgi:AcrR family transcriptional regulator
MSRDPDDLALDRYLDGLLAGDVQDPSRPHEDMDPELARAARVVSAALVRFHPSFRFEERLATRLRAIAVADAPAPDPATAGGVVIPFVTPWQRPRGRSRRVNGALIGGAISAGVSLASIAAGALVARRRGRGDGRWERVI